MSSEDEQDASGRMIVWPLERLARLMRAREHEGGLNPAQWEALRFLGRANRFSNSPGALTRYLGATKGTISQTVKALERKGYVTKAARGGAAKALSLSLTPKGVEALQRDPWANLAAAAEDLGGKTRRRMHRGLTELLSQQVAQGGLDTFGSCGSCRYFRERGREDEPGGPHHCMLFDEALSEEEAARICIAHAMRP